MDSINNILDSLGINREDVQAVVLHQEIENNGQTQTTQQIIPMNNQHAESVELPAETVETEATEVTDNAEDLSDNDFNDILQDHDIVTEDADISSLSEDSEDSDNQETEETEESNNQEPDNQESESSEEHQETEAHLSEISPTLLIDDSTSRFSGTEWYNTVKTLRICIAGLGGIGSHLAFNIGRLSPHIVFLYDDDRVESVNLSGQLYTWRNVGDYKVSATKEFIALTSSYSSNIYALSRKFLSIDMGTDIMLCGFDNMEARKMYYNAWKTNVLSKRNEEDKKECLFLDGRLSIDTLQILCIRGDDSFNMDRYEREFLFPSSEAEETVCSMKQCTYMASMIGSLMTNLVVNFAANINNPVIPYSLPFFTEYNANYMIFKIEN